MADYSSVCYRNNFLNQVIVRIDFLGFVQSSLAFDESIEKEVLRIFPRRGKDQIIRFNSVNFVFNQDGNGLQKANGETIEGIQREYSTTDGVNRLILTNKYMIFEINRYSSYDEHRQWFQSILLAFYQKNRVSATRTGIRYINIFDSTKMKLQKNYFITEIAASLRVTTNEELPPLIRSMHMSEYRIDDMTMNFRYGMYNPEYPNVLKKNSYALDYDFFSSEVIDSAEGIIRVLDKGHQEIQAMFENSITNSLREVMSNE